jgi:hypothetical protein
LDAGFKKFFDLSPGRHEFKFIIDGLKLSKAFFGKREIASNEKEREKEGL